MKLLRLKQVMDITGLGRSSIYNYMKDGTFPKQVKITANLSAWVDSEIEEWVKHKIKERDGELDIRNAGNPVVM
jgi:prophage regulatory protein